MADMHELAPEPNGEEITEQRDSGIEIDVDVGNDAKVSRNDFDPGGHGVLFDIQRLYIKSSRLGNRFLFQTTQRINEMEKYLDKRRHTQDSILQIVETLSGQSEEGLRSSRPQTFQDLKIQLVDDSNTLRAQSQALQDMDTSIGTTQFKLMAVQSRLMAALATYNSSLPGAPLRHQAMGTERDSELFTPSEVSEDLPQQAQAYFDAVGDVSLLQERIYDLDDEHAEARTARDLAKDQERALSISDSVFESGHQDSRAELLRSLDISASTAEHAKKVCEDEGIDLEALRHRSRLNNSLTEGEPLPPHQLLSWPDSQDVFRIHDSAIDEGFLIAKVLDLKSEAPTVNGAQALYGTSLAHVESWLSHTVNEDKASQGRLTDVVRTSGGGWPGRVHHPDEDPSEGGMPCLEDIMTHPRSGSSRRKAVRRFHRASYRRCSASAIDTFP